MIGGVNWPPDEADASTAAAKLFEKPCFLIIGIVNTPVPAMFAATDPLIMPNSALATIAACAAPPRIRAVSTVDILMRLSPAPVWLIIAPRIRKTRTVLKTNPVTRPKTPSNEYHAICIKLLRSIPKCCKTPGRCGPAKPKETKQKARITSDQPQARRVASSRPTRPSAPANIFSGVPI